MQWFLRYAVPADVQVSRIHVNNDILLGQLSGMECFDLFLHRLRDIRYRCRCVILSVQLFDKICDLSRRYPFLVQQDDRVFEIITSSCIRRQQMLTEIPLPIPWYIEMKDTVL
jgi:hypothetical protein